MYHVYVLKSVVSGKRYVGFTSQSPQDKLIEHNQGSATWTRANGPFELVYSESAENKTKALAREKFFKSGDGRRVLDRLIETQ